MGILLSALLSARDHNYNDVNLPAYFQILNARIIKQYTQKCWCFSHEKGVSNTFLTISRLGYTMMLLWISYCIRQAIVLGRTQAEFHSQVGEEHTAEQQQPEQELSAHRGEYISDDKDENIQEILDLWSKMDHVKFEFIVIDVK
ncbi:hypothetical protein ACET3Z_030684 [Daucus carota]